MASTPYLGQIMYTGFAFAPRQWAQCNGQILPLSQNTALFSLLGTFYGGNGSSTFGLPDMRGRVPMHWGNGNGLTPRSLGEQDGFENTSLTSANVALHTHNLVATSSKATTATPTNGADILGRAVATTQLPLVYVPAPAPNSFTPLSPLAISANIGGGSTPFAILQPILGMNCNIATAGVYPARN